MAMIKYSLQGGERILFCEIYVYIYICKKKIQIDNFSVNYMLYLHTYCKNLHSKLPSSSLESVECTWHFQSTIHVIQK